MKEEDILAIWQLSVSVPFEFQCLFVPLGVLLVVNTLKHEWHVVMKVYKLSIFEIFSEIFSEIFFVLPYIACLCCLWY